MTKGIVFGIQHFSIHDGNGIRSNVFLKGCPLRCLWCHNPEGLDCRIEMQYFEQKCKKCERCGNVYQTLPSIISKTAEEKKQIADSCPYGALELVGQEMSVEEVLEEVGQDMRFFKTSKGGITVSGGEPMLQFDFLKRLLKKAKEQGMETALETSGYAEPEAYMQILPYVDEFLWDYKETDSRRHMELTGVSNKKILSNLDTIYHSGAKIILRCPIIPGINDTEKHFRGIADLLSQYKRLKGWEIMPYHKMGISKEKRIGKERNYLFDVPEKEQVQKWEMQIKAYRNFINDTKEQ